GRLYHEQPALWKFDHEPRGFTWIDCNDSQSSVLSFIRWASGGEHLVVVCNFTPVPRFGYRIGVPRDAYYKELLNTDSSIYGGTNFGNDGGVQSENWAMHNHHHSVVLRIPPMGCIILKAQ